MKNALEQLITCEQLSAQANVIINNILNNFDEDFKNKLANILDINISRDCLDKNKVALLDTTKWQEFITASSEYKDHLPANVTKVTLNAELTKLNGLLKTNGKIIDEISKGIVKEAEDIEKKQAEIQEQKLPTPVIVTVKELKDSLKNSSEDKKVEFIKQHFTNPTVQDYQILLITNEIFLNYQPQLSKFLKNASVEELYEANNRIDDYQNDISLKERVLLGTQDRQNAFLENLRKLQGNIAESMQSRIDLDKLVGKLNGFVNVVNYVYSSDEESQDKLQQFNISFRTIVNDDQVIFSKDIIATIEQEQVQTIREMVKFFNKDLKDNYKPDDIAQILPELSELKDSLDLLETIKSLPRNLSPEQANIPENKTVLVNNNQQIEPDVTVDYTSLIEKANIVIKRVIDKNFTDPEKIKNILQLDTSILDQNNIAQITSEQWQGLITSIEYRKKDDLIQIKLDSLKNSLKEYNLLEKEAAIINELPSKEALRSWQENAIPEKRGLIAIPTISAAINLIEKPAEQLELLQGVQVKTLKVFAENPQEFAKLCQITEPDTRIAIIAALNKCSEEILRNILPEAVAQFCAIKEPEQQLNIALSLKDCQPQFLTEILSEPLIFAVPALLPQPETTKFFAVIAEYSKEQRQAVLSDVAYDLCSIVPKEQRSAILVMLKDTPKSTLTLLKNHISQIEKIIAKTPESSRVAIIDQLTKYEPKILEEVLEAPNNFLQLYEKVPDLEKLDLITSLRNSSSEQRQAIFVNLEKTLTDPTSPSLSFKTSDSTASSTDSTDKKYGDEIPPPPPKKKSGKLASTRIDASTENVYRLLEQQKEMVATLSKLRQRLGELQKHAPKMSATEEVRKLLQEQNKILATLTKVLQEQKEMLTTLSKAGKRGDEVHKHVPEMSTTVSEQNKQDGEFLEPIKDSNKTSLNPNTIKTAQDSKKEQLLNSKNAQWLYDNQVTTREELGKITDVKKIYNLTSDPAIALCKIDKENFSILLNNTELRKKFNEPASHKIIHLLEQQDPLGRTYISLAECTDNQRIDNLMSMTQLKKIVDIDPSNSRIVFDNSANKLFVNNIDNPKIIELLTTKDSEGKSNLTLSELVNDIPLLAHVNLLLRRDYFKGICDLHPDNLKILLNTRDEKIIDGLNNQRVVDLLTAKDQSGKHYVNLLALSF